MTRLSARLVYPVVLFVIVALFVATLVIGVIFFAHQRGEQVRRDKAQEIAAQQDRDQSSETPAAENPATEEEAPIVQPPVDEAPEENPTSNEELPTTGPMDVLYTIFAATALSLAIGYYAASRRAAHKS